MKRVAIIGATSAIAIEVARCYAQERARIVLIARHGDRTATIQADLLSRGATDVKIILGDIAVTTQHERWCREALAAFDGLDVVLLAYGTLGDAENAPTDFSMAEDIIHVNFVSAVSWLTRFAEAFERAGAGTIAAIGSVAGDRGRKSNYLYGASKAGLERYLQGLRNRLFSRGIRVITIKPGFVDTPMTRQFKKGLLFASAERVGRSIFKVLEARGILSHGDVVYVPFFWRFIMCVIQLIPERIFKRMSI